MQSFKLKFLGVTILQGVEFPIFLLIFEWALQQCSATALPVIQINPSKLAYTLIGRNSYENFQLYRVIVSENIAKCCKRLLLTDTVSNVYHYDDTSVAQRIVSISIHTLHRTITRFFSFKFFRIFSLLCFRALLSVCLTVCL